MFEEAVQELLKQHWMQLTEDRRVAIKIIYVYLK